MNAYEIERLEEAFGDGYSNECQRGSAAFRAEYNWKDERPEARELVAGRIHAWVIILSHSVYGPCDEIAGRNHRIYRDCDGEVLFFASKQHAYDHLDWLSYSQPAIWDDCDCEVIGPEFLGPDLPYGFFDKIEDCPF